MDIKDEGITILKRTQRLSVATYQVTHYFNDQEALKWELRKESTSALARANDVFNNIRDDRRKDLEAMLSQLNRIIVLLDLALDSENFSYMNCSLLRAEYVALGNHIKERKSSNPVVRSEHTRSDLYLAGGTEGHDVSERPYGHYTDFVKDTIKDNKDKGQSPIDNAALINQGRGAIASERKRHVVTPRPLQSDRRDRILTFLKTNGESGITDIVATVTGYSTKTIQRELAQLVNAGHLERIGEKRWSRYKIRD